MKFVHNTGSDRVIDVIRLEIGRVRRLDMLTSAFSLFAFAEMFDDLLQSRNVTRNIDLSRENHLLINKDAPFTLELGLS